MRPVAPERKRERIEERATFELIRYANCWEDADVLVAALAPAPGARILSIASAGDNAFALAAAGAEVVAVDLSQAQLALVELKRAALATFDHPDALGFLGARPSSERARRYASLRGRLPAGARAYWDGNQRAIEGGVIHAGKFERYFQLFRRRVLPLVHRRSTIRALLEPRARADRHAFYRDTWDNRRWRSMFRLFFSRAVMGRLGRDPEFFRYVEGEVGPRILARTRHALTELPTHDNPYLEYILTGGFARALPRYLLPENADAVRAGLERISLHCGPIEQAAAGARFTGFNLSDIFEYIDESLCAEVYRALLDAARPGARLAYWNMLAPRRRPARFADRVRSLDDLARPLFLADRAFFYSAFVIEEVLPSPGSAI